MHKNEFTNSLRAAEALNRIFRMRPEAVLLMAEIIDREYTGRQQEADRAE